VTVPAKWIPSPSSSTGIRGLDPATTTVFTLSPGLRAFAVVTFAEADDASLIPAPLRGVLELGSSDPQTGKLAGQPAWQYAALPLDRRDGLIDVTTVATGAGVLSVACLASRSVWAAASGCASEVRRIALDGTGVVAPADMRFRLDLAATLKPLAKARASGQAALRAAGTPDEQAAAAGRLSAAYGTAAEALGPAPAEPQGAPVVTLIGRIRDGYGRLSESAAAGAARRYDAARSAVAKAEAALADALAGLQGS
jgi:hypothetical protein